MPQYELAAVDDKTEDASNQKEDRGGTAARNGRLKRVAIIVGAVLLGLLILILLIWGISALLGHQLLMWEQDSFIESVPGSHYPINSSEDTGNLIWVSSATKDGYIRWVDIINNFLNPYRFYNKVSKRTIVECDYNRKPPAGTVCNVDIKRLYPCVAENYYNYHRGSPCVFLKFNEVPDWVPEFYNSSSHLPENMPNNLKHTIKEVQARNSLQINTVWVSCEGENAADVENIGPLQYFPIQGFPGYFFPYKGQDGYLSPLVSVFFERPTLGVLINVVCKLWAPNIKHEGVERLAETHFELLID